MPGRMRPLALFLTALALDVALGEPPTPLHPTAWVGRTLPPLEGLGLRLDGRRQRLFGLAVAVALPLVLAWRASGWLAGLERRSPWLAFLAEAALLKSTFAVRGLLGEARALRQTLERDDLPAARWRARSLVGRDVSVLDGPRLVSAGLESLAENTTDAFLAPWLYYLLLGTPGALAYRAINTMDAMWGYRGRYEELGKAAARLDDAANLLPARLAALLLALASGRPLRALATAWRHHRRTESPNAGWTMAAMAGALGVELEKPGHYRLGETRRPLRPHLLDEGTAIVARTAALGAALVAGVLLLRGRRQGRG